MKSIAEQMENASGFISDGGAMTHKHAAFIADRYARDILFLYAAERDFRTSDPDSRLIEIDKEVNKWMDEKDIQLAHGEYDKPLPTKFGATIFHGIKYFDKNGNSKTETNKQ